MDENRSTIRFIQIDVELKDWLQAVPSAEDARPGKCPSCGVVSRTAGQRLRLHGHGTRNRQVQGPLGATEASEIVEVTLRRYLCKECGAVIVAGPRGLVARRLYSAAAIAMALARWALLMEPAAEVRCRVSPWRVIGATAAAGWASLRRWSRALRRRHLWPEVTLGLPLDGTLRDAAGVTVAKVAALASASGPVWLAAFAGASRAR
jgi:hypothetical protein